MLRYLNGARRQIYSRTQCPSACELQQISSHSASDLEERRSRKLIESHDFRHPRRVILVTVMFDRVEELTRAELMLTSELRAARILSPLLARSKFFLHQTAHPSNDSLADYSISEQERSDRFQCAVCASLFETGRFAPVLKLSVFNVLQLIGTLLFSLVLPFVVSV